MAGTMRKQRSKRQLSFAPPEEDIMCARPSEKPKLFRRGSSGGMKGQIRIRLLDAHKLLPVENALFYGASSNPYAVVFLRHQSGKQSHSRRTNQVKRTLNPKWRATFEFSVKEPPPDLTLHVQVFHQTSQDGIGGLFLGQGKGDQFLGQAELPLTEVFTHAEPYAVFAPHKELPLRKSDEHPTVTDVGGTIRLELGWLPGLYWKGDLKNTQALWADAVKSPQVIRVVHVALLGMAGLLLLVAQGCRWLCRGSCLSDCQDVPVPGARICAALGGLMSMTAFVIHFLGTAGAFGSLWTRRSLQLLDLLEKDAAEESDEMEEEENLEHQPERGPGFAVKATVNPGLPGAGFEGKVRISPTFFTRSGIESCITGIRLFSMLMHMTAVSLAGTALWLASLQGRFVIFAEASILDVQALILLISAFFFSLRERRLKLDQERSRWHHMADIQKGEEQNEPWRANNSLKDVQEWSSRTMERTVAEWGVATQQARTRVESLTQPLLDRVNSLPRKVRTNAMSRIESLEGDMQRLINARLGSDTTLQQWLNLSPPPGANVTIEEDSPGRTGQRKSRGASPGEPSERGGSTPATLHWQSRTSLLEAHDEHSASSSQETEDGVKEEPYCQPKTVLCCSCR